MYLNCGESFEQFHHTLDSASGNFFTPICVWDQMVSKIFCKTMCKDDAFADSLLSKGNDPDYDGLILIFINIYLTDFDLSIKLDTWVSFDCLWDR